MPQMVMGGGSGGKRVADERVIPPLGPDGRSRPVARPDDRRVGQRCRGGNGCRRRRGAAGANRRQEGRSGRSNRRRERRRRETNAAGRTSSKTENDRAGAVSGNLADVEREARRSSTRSPSSRRRSAGGLDEREAERGGSPGWPFRVAEKVGLVAADHAAARRISRAFMAALPAMWSAWPWVLRMAAGVSACRFSRIARIVSDVEARIDGEGISGPLGASKRYRRFCANGSDSMTHDHDLCLGHRYLREASPRHNPILHRTASDPQAAGPEEGFDVL